MRSLEVQLGLEAAKSGSSYFDYVEEKLIRHADSRMKLIENKQLIEELAQFAQSETDPSSEF